MSATNKKPNQREAAQQSINQQANAMTRLTLNTPSTTPKMNTQQQQQDEDAGNVIYTNHFPCSFATDLTFYQYDATVEEYHDRDQKYIPFSNREKRRQFVTDILFEKKIHPTAICWYDEGSCMYSTTNLQDKLPIVHENEEQRRRYRLTVNSLSATSGTHHLDHSAIRIIETLIKQALKEQFKAIGSVFYQWDAEPRPDGPYDLLTGFKQALCLTEDGPTLNMDITVTRFYPHSELLPFIWERILGQKKADFCGVLSDQQYYNVGGYLKDVEVTTYQSENRSKYVLTGQFSDALPAQIVINENQNLLDYYKGLDCELQYPRLYCFKAYPLGKPQHVVDLPIELCSLREWQEVKVDEGTKPVPAPPVNERYNAIMAAIRSCNFVDNPLFQEIQLQIDRNEMMAIPYDTLQQRQVTLSRRNRYTQSIPIDRMGFIYLADHNQRDARQVQNKLLDSFYEVASQQRINLPEHPDQYEIYANQNLESTLRNRLSQLKKDRCEFILCLENCRDVEVHKVFKRIAYSEFGLITQCVNFGKIMYMRNLRSYCGNLFNSLNAKLSVENKQVTELQTDTTTMFIGADVQHAKNNYQGELPSIAAVVASMNSECTVTNQRVSRQWPNKGKQSEEAILLLREMVQELLVAFREVNNGSLPEHVIFYRDGVDDGQFERVLNEEVAALKQAFKAIYPAKSDGPLLTFLVVKKRHHTRLFRRLPSSEIINVESGVVVDSSIVNPNYPSFFLNSHQPRIGTNKIGSYVVLMNEIEYSLDVVEEITYSLCHADQRIDGRMSESIPSVVHLADAAAGKGRQLFNNNTRPANGSRAEMLRIHQDAQNAPNMF